MTTTTVFASTADADIRSSNATYATAAAGGSLTVSSNSELHCGQFSGYNIRTIFVDFDTSGIPDSDAVSQVDLQLYGKEDQSSANFDLVAKNYDWSSGGLTTADWRTPTQLAALTTLGSLNTASFSTSGYNTITSVGAAFNSHINKTGVTYLCIASSQLIAATAPVDDAFVVFHSTSVAGTTQDPKITITHAGETGTPVGRGDETDTALALSGKAIRTTGLGSEADSAFALAAKQVRAAGRADETGSAFATGVARPVGLGTESDTALPLGAARPTGLAVEADTSLARGGVSVRSLGRGDELDTAFALGVARAVGLSTETDTALALGGAAGTPVGLSSETDTALALGGKSIRASGIGSETESAFALAAKQIRAIGVASEAVSAFALGSSRPTGHADETDTALGLAAKAVRPLGRADETDTALAPGGVAVGRADEVDTAFALSALLIRTAGRADETDSALRLIASIPLVTPFDRTINWPPNRISDRLIDFI